MLMIIEDTPGWVFAVFFYALYYGIIACFRRDINVNKLLILPGVFIGLSLWTVISYSQPGKMLLCWVIAFLCSSFLTMYFVNKAKIIPGKKDKTISIPGTCSVLIVFLLYFAVRYYAGYQEAISRPLGLNSTQLVIIAVASGLTAGFYTGRSLRVYLRYRDFLTNL